MKPSRCQLNSKWVHLGYQSFILRTTVIISIHHKFFTHIFIIIIMTIMDHILMDWFDFNLFSLFLLLAYSINGSQNFGIEQLTDKSSAKKKVFTWSTLLLDQKSNFFLKLAKNYKNNSAMELRKWKTREELKEENHDHAWKIQVCRYWSSSSRHEA